MTVLKYVVYVAAMAFLSYCTYWFTFRPNQTSPVPWIAVLLLGIVLFCFTVYMVIIKSHSIHKLGVNGEPQEPAH